MSLGLVPLAQPAVLETVREVENHAHQEPHAESNPRDGGQAKHKIETHRDAEQGNDRHEWRLKDPFSVGICFSQNDDSYAHQDECKQRPYVRQLHDLVDVGDRRNDRNDHAGPDRRDVWRAKLRVYFGKVLGEEAVPGHREEYSRLTQLKHQKDRRHGYHRSQGNYAGSPVEP